MKKFTQLLAVLALGTAPAWAQGEPVWQSVSAGSEQTYAIKSDGTLWAWGSAEYGELGNGAKAPAKVSTPTQIGTNEACAGKKWKTAIGGSGRAFFIATDGTLWSTGTAEGGVLGTNSSTAQLVPTQIGTDTDWACAATSNAGDNYVAMAIKTDGTLWGWGKNSVGVLGLGGYTTKAVPNKVGDDSDWVMVSIGRSHSLVLKADGTIWGAGESQKGALGDNMDSNYKPTLVKVADAAGWVKVFAIDDASYALKADGTLWAWGSNYSDILTGSALSTEENEVSYLSTPTQMTAFTEKVISISGSQYNRVVIVGDGNVATKAYAWGYDYSGAVGNGQGTDFGDIDNATIYTTPQEVKFDAPVALTEVTSGQNFTVVLTEGGKLLGWGSNAWGQLGTSEPENMLGAYKTTPIEVAAAVEKPTDGAEFDAKSIPASLNGIANIKLLGEWGTSDFEKLIAPLGNGQGLMGFTYNTALVSVDMSEVTFLENTSLSKIFRNCTALETVTFPTNESVANIVSLNNAFLNDQALASINVAGLVNVTDIDQAFQNCKAIQMLDLSAWNGVETSEMAFQNCAALTTVILPKAFVISDRCFGACYALRLIDWSKYAGTEAPVIVTSDKYEPFNNIDFVPSEKKAIVVIVPEAAYQSFSTDKYWSGFTIEKAALPGSVTIDGDDIPASLTDAIHITLTGAWDTDKFAKLAKALGTGAALTSANSTVVSIDMSAAQIAAGTKLVMKVPGGLFGTADKGVFQNFKTLETVIMPAADQAANFTSFLQAFYGCSALTAIDLSGCTGLTETNAAFYQCSALETVKLPAAFPFNKEVFDRCEALKTLDMSAFEGTTAPTLSSNAIPMRGKELTVIVPDEAYDSFVATSPWSSFNIVKKSTSGIEDVEAAEADAPRAVYNLNGQYITSLPAGQGTDTLPAGFYIVGGKKVIVR